MRRLNKVNKNIRTNIKETPAIVEIGSSDVFNYPFLHMTGHGNVIFSPALWVTSYYVSSITILKHVKQTS